MIGLVEGAKRQKTPNEIALTILLSALTIIFLLVLMTLKPFGIYSGVDFSITVLVALLVCLIPTTIGGLLSAIGIAGIDRLRAEKRAGDERARGRGRRRRGRAAARQDRHDHARQSPGHRVHSRAGRDRAANWPTPRNFRRSPTKRPKAAASSCWPRKNTAFADANCTNCRTRTFVPFTAQTRMSGVDINGTRYRKGAADASREVRRRQSARRQSQTDVDNDLQPRRHAAGRRDRTRKVLGVDLSQGHRQRRPGRTLRTLPRDGHPHGHDHRRQSADRRRDRGGSGRG